ncbi:MAG: SRPBCC family protein [Gammaproteobacteria bacterium]
MRLLIPLLCFTFVYSTQVLANEVTEFEVTEEKGVFHIRASVVVHVPAKYVRAVLTDYVHIYRLNPSVVESEVLTSQDDNVTRVRTKVIGCVVSYCTEIERVDDVRVLASGDIQAKIVPQSSQFKSGVALWQIRPMGENTLLTYVAEMEPDFFIPPLIGTSIVKDKLQDEVMISFTALERIASIQLERDWDPDWIVTNWMESSKTKVSEQSGVDK